MIMIYIFFFTVSLFPSKNEYSCSLGFKPVFAENSDWILWA